MRKSGSSRSFIAFLFMVVTLLPGSMFAQSQPLFTETLGFATKTGFRGVFSWKATQPVQGIVRFGTSPTALTQSVEPVPGVSDTAQIAIAFLNKGQTYYWQVEDKLTGKKSAIQQFESKNAYNDWNGSAYTIGLMVQLDSQALDPSIPNDLALTDIAQGINVFAERFYDATDGFIRVGKVIVTDTNFDYAGNIPFQPVVCSNTLTNVADVLVQTSVPFDSHTFGGFAIDNPCIGFYVGRLGQLVVPWEDDLHFGFVAAHEMAHYALSAPDLYPEAPNGGGGDCKNLAWDGSLMHNTGGWNGTRWELTELDRNPTLTPCVHGTNSYSWDRLRERYTEVPLLPTGPISDLYNDKARGNPDGGALEIWILDREPGASTLTRFEGDDNVAVCTPTSPQISDASGDATGVFIVEGTPLPSEPSLDILSANVRWNDTTKALTFTIKVKDLTDLPPNGAVGHYFRYYFTYNNTAYQLIARRDPTGEVRSLLKGDNTSLGTTGLAGSFNAATDEITIVLPASRFATAQPAAPPLAIGQQLGGFQVLAQRYLGAPTLTADTGRGSCSYTIGQENMQPNGAPVAVDDTAATTEDASVDINVLANDRDPEGDPISIVSATAGSNGTTAVNANGTIRYTPRATFSGSDQFSYTIKDSNGGTGSAKVSVTVANAPDAPIARNDSAATPASTSVRIDVLANDTDEDGDSLAIVSVTQGAQGATAVDGNAIVYTPGGGFTGGDTFNYTVSDPSGLRSTATVTVFRSDCFTGYADDFEPGADAGWTYSNANTGLPTTTTWTVLPDPLASSGTNSFFTDTSDLSPDKDDRLISPAVKATPMTKLSFWHRFGFEDTYDGGVIEVSSDGGATWADVTAVGGFFEKFGYNGTSSALNSRPAFTNLSPTTMSETVVNLGALAGKTINIRFRAKTDANSGSIGWRLDDVRFTDISGTNCSLPTNRLPVAVDDSAVTQESAPVTINVLANDSDPNGDAIRVQSVTSPSNGSVVTDGRTITYTPRSGFGGTDTFHYTLEDAFGGTDVAKVTVEVNRNPVAANDSVSTAEDRAITINVLANDNDADGDAVIATSVTGASNGTTVLNSDGSVSYSPRLNFHGADSFSYSISDGRGGAATGQVSVTVVAVNDAPVANTDSATTAKNRSVTIDVVANDSDVDGDALRIISVGRPQRGSASITPDNKIRFSPRPGFRGTDSFEYTIEDGQGATASARVTVTVD